MPEDWSQCINFVSQSDTAFGIFLEHYITEALDDGTLQGPLPDKHPLLPLPCPFPCAERELAGQLPSSSRRRQRAGVRQVAMRWCNRITAALTFMDDTVDREGAWRRARPSAWQAEVAAVLLHDLVGWCRRPFAMADGRGGRSGKLMEVIRRLATSGYENSHDTEKLTTVALPVVADRIALPAAAGGLDPLEYLSTEEKRLFCSWKDRELPRHAQARPERSCHRVSGDEEVKLFKRLMESDMAVLASENDIRAARAKARGELIDWHEDLAPGGVFAVPHKPHADRLIYDRRPRNSLEKRFDWGKLPSGSQWAQTVLPPSCAMRGSAEDLSTYFY